ncbi:hypothetical protein Bca52824_004059 [Brassica carinata]|uniref:Receptor-like protein 12 n=1 Tax=Brassica carinata TaxID=52824 RepID=A0A8X7WKX2_BRACI|nr:hypothetical protein Bca52824_004059 [Brassica carinata]
MLGSHLILSFLLLCCISVTSIFVMKNPVTGLVPCPPRHLKALMQFKNEFDSTGCNQTEYLNGAWCDNTTGEVTKLQIPSGCFSGTLYPNSTLFQFHHLRFLNLTRNHFASSPLPSGFGTLNKLQVLSLSSNGFRGQVPTSFSNLTLLSFLDLSINDLTGSFPLIHNLTKLLVIDLSNNHFSGTVPSSLFSMPLLSFLDLSMNKLTGTAELPNSSSSTRLERISLAGNNFGGEILEPISKLITLTQLDLSYVNISHPIDLRLFSSLGSMSYLDLSGNIISPTSLSSDSAGSIPLAMENLFLLNCGISEFPNMLKSLENLTYVDISNNRIKGKVPEWLWSLPHLNTVVVSDNSLNGFEGSATVLVNSSVELLDLSSNSFRGTFIVPPLSIVSLFARGNHFTGNILSSICNCSSLMVLDLSYNNFTGLIPQCLSNLTLLSLRKNNFEGSLPDMFYSGSSLHTLDVGYNRLSGKLPESLLNCSSLALLSVEHNRIQDSFPFWLKALPNLQVLVLRSNRFYGPISPSDQGPLGFTVLRIFEISDNNFTGSLPPNYFLNWKSTSQKNEDGGIYMGYETQEAVSTSYEDAIDLQYKGLVMEQQKVLLSYSTIDFSGNGLEGNIPESIGFLKTLIALNLSNNTFTGPIPLPLANLTELQSLDLSRNKLSGTIPNGLKTLSFLGYINVSHNQLEGEIPQGTQITGQPESSFEGNAGLCGLPLKESCFASNSPPTQQPKEEDEEEEEQVLSWKAVVIGFGPGLLVGLAVAQVIASYKVLEGQEEWLVSSCSCITSFVFFILPCVSSLEHMNAFSFSCSRKPDNKEETELFNTKHKGRSKACFDHQTKRRGRAYMPAYNIPS